MTLRTIVKVIDYEGKLTIDWGKIQSWIAPQIDRELTVFNVKSENYPVFLNKELLCQVDGDNVVLYHEGRPWYMDAPSEKITLSEPLKKPRKGKGYDWEYKMGQWVKTWQK